MILLTLPIVANRFDFGSNFASKISVGGFFLQIGFQHVSKFHTIISFPALNNKSNVGMFSLCKRLFF